MESAKINSQKYVRKTFRLDEADSKEYKDVLKEYAECMEKVRNGEMKDPEFWKSYLKETRPNLHMMYGFYISYCEKNGIKKRLTYRTFYMQCRGYRTLKNNVIEALSFGILALRDKNSTGAINE